MFVASLKHIDGNRDVESSGDLAADKMIKYLVDAR